MAIHITYDTMTLEVGDRVGLPRFAAGYLGWGSDAHPGGLAGGRGPG